MTRLVEVTISATSWQELFNALLPTDAGEAVMEKDKQGRDVIAFIVQMPLEGGTIENVQVAILSA